MNAQPVDEGDAIPANPEKAAPQVSPQVSMDEDIELAEPSIKDNLKTAAKDKQSRRLFYVTLLAGAAAVGGLYYYTHQPPVGGAPETAPAAKIDRPVAVPKEEEPMAPPTNPMAGRLAQGYEKVLAQQAAEAGKTYIAPPPTWQEQRDPLAPAGGNQRPQSLNQTRIREQQEKNKAEFAKRLIQGWSAAPAMQVVSFPVARDQGDITPEELASVGEATLHLPAGTRFYASISGTVDSYTPGPVRAVVEEGPLEGAVLLGSLKALPTERLVLTFNTLSIGNRSYSINAIALDAVDELPAVSGEVDRHYLRRYVLPFAINLLAGYGQTLAYGTDIAVTGSGVVVGNNDISETDRWLYAAGQAGMSMLPPLGAGDATKYAQVILHDGQGIGVMLLEDMK